MKYPSVYLRGQGSHADVLSLAYAGSGQHQDAGAKAVHLAPHTSSNIVSKSISRGGGRTSYRGLLHIAAHAKHSKAKVKCDALLMDSQSRSDTYPTNDVRNSDVQIEHEATVSKVGEEQLFYLRSRGLTENEATSLIVAGFIEPIAKELPLEYAVELNRLIQLEMEGSVG
jgi:Fe-S cluster assembly protein SufB